MNVELAYARPTAPWQFQLKHLFGLMTYSAVAAGIAVRFGPGTLMASVGMLLACLNVACAFVALQRGRNQAVLLWAAWGLFLVSLALPSVRVFGPVRGYGAAWFALCLPLEWLRWSDFPPLFASLLLLTVDVANAAMVVVPLLIWRLNKGRGQWLGAALCIAAVASWCCGPVFRGEMYVGYYVWCVSFFVALIALRINVRTLAAMFGVIALAAIATIAVAQPQHYLCEYLEHRSGGRWPIPERAASHNANRESRDASVSNHDCGWPYLYAICRGRRHSQSGRHSAAAGRSKLGEGGKVRQVRAGKDVRH